MVGGRGARGNAGYAMEYAVSVCFLCTVTSGVFLCTIYAASDREGCSCLDCFQSRKVQHYFFLFNVNFCELWSDALWALY